MQRLFRGYKLEPCLRHRANGTTGAKDRSRNIDAVAGILSNFSIFQALDHQNLRDIVALLKLKKIFPERGYPEERGSGQEPLHHSGGRSGCARRRRRSAFRPSERRCIRRDEPDQRRAGGATIKVVEPAKIIFIKGQDFKENLNNFPSIQMYLAKLLAQRLAKSNLAVAEEIASGMLGRLSEMPPPEIFQTLNLNQKTGRCH